MNILISEDNEVKFETIQEFIKKSYPEASIRHAEDISTTLDYIDDFLPDVIIQDMQLPHFEGLKTSYCGGAEVISDVKFYLKNGVIDKMPIIVVCSSDYASEDILQDWGFSDIPFAYFSLSSENWKDVIKENIEKK